MLKRSVALISLNGLTPKFGVNKAEISFIILGPKSNIIKLNFSIIYVKAYRSCH